MTANLRWSSYENKFDVCAHTEGMYEYGMLSVEHTHAKKKTLVRMHFATMAASKKEKEWFPNFRKWFTNVSSCLETSKVV